MGNGKPSLHLPEIGYQKLDANSMFYGNNSITKSILSDYPIKCTPKNKKLLTFAYYEDYKKLIKRLKKKLIEDLKISPMEVNRRTSIKNQIYNSYMNWLDNDLNMEKIFNYSIAIYHRISSIYGVNDNYPPEELEAITIPMISKYLSYEYEKEDLNLVADKIIKRIKLAFIVIEHKVLE